LLRVSIIPLLRTAKQNS